MTRGSKTTQTSFGALGAVALFVLPCAFGLNPEFAISQYAHTSWKIQDGFSRGPIHSIAQTPDGYLWFGTEFGLLRFDGVKVVTWQPPKDQHLPSNRIHSLLVSRDGTLWIGTFKGVVSWKDEALTNYEAFAGQMSGQLYEDREGTIWASMLALPRGKLCAIRNGNVRCDGEDGRLGIGVFGLHEDSKGNLWAGVSRGLWRWRPGAPKLYSFPDDPDGIQGYGADDDGALLICTRNGLMRFVDGNADRSPIIDMVKPFKARKLLRDSDGGLWIGTASQGLVHVYKGKMDVFTASEGLSGDTINRIYQDREGNIWVVTREGLDRFRDFAVPTLSSKQRLTSGWIGSVVAARDGSVWMGTSDGLTQWNNGRITIYRKSSVGSSAHPRPQQEVREIAADGLPDNIIESIFEDDRGRIWVTTIRGVAYLENGRFHQVESVSSKMVHAIAQDARGTVWIADQSTGLFQIAGDDGVRQSPYALVRHEDAATAMMGDPRRGGVWLGFLNGGVTHFNEDQIGASYGVADGLGQGRITDLRVDPDGTVWAATDGGLSRLKNGRIATLSSKNGLPCDSVFWMREDDSQSVWLNTECGLLRVARSEWNAWTAAVDGPSSTGSKDPNRGWTLQTTVYDSSAGVAPAASATGYSPMVAKSADGKLWFLSRGSISVLDPTHLPLNKLAPPVHIEQITADRKIYDTMHKKPNELRLPALVRDLKIDYTAVSLAAPEKVRFRYKLEGHDTDWQEVGNRREAFYSDLPPSNYRFRVIACNNSGVWNETGALLEFSIAPAYYQTLWFRLLLLAGFGAMLAMLYRFRLRQLARQSDLRVEARVNERTRIARELHDTLLQDLAGVSLQLDGVAKQAAKAPEKVAPLINSIREQVDSCFREARVKIWQLRSPEVAGQGLAAALQDFVERIGPVTAARCGFTLSGQPRPCAPDVEEELLQIAQEAATNATKHGHPNEIQVDLEYGAGILKLCVSDNGRGFELEEGYSKPGHWGLRTMQERAALIRGKCMVTSEVGRGTRVEVEVPLAARGSRR